MRNHHFAVAVLSLVLSVPAFATLVAYEGFDYSVGPVNGQSGGTGFSGGWVSGGGTVGAPLTFPDIPDSGNGLSAAGSSNDLDYRLLSTDRSGTDTWISLLYRRESVSNTPTGFTIGSGNAELASGFITGTRGLFVGQPGPSANIALTATGSSFSRTAGTGSTLNTTYLLVMHLDYTAANSGTVRVWVNPDLAGPGGANVSIDFSLAALDRIGLEAGDGLRVDEIRIGDSFAAVIPEPSMFGLVALGLALLRRRCR